MRAKDIFYFSLFMGVAMGLVFLILSNSETIYPNILGCILAFCFYRFLNTPRGKAVWKGYMNVYKSIYKALGLDSNDLTKE